MKEEDEDVGEQRVQDRKTSEKNRRAVTPNQSVQPIPIFAGTTGPGICARRVEHLCAQGRGRKVADMRRLVAKAH